MASQRATTRRDLCICSVHMCAWLCVFVCVCLYVCVCMCVCTQMKDQDIKELQYLQAVGSYRSGKYVEARRILKELLMVSAHAATDARHESLLRMHSA